MTRSLAEMILQLGTTYDSQVAFRDRVLTSSALGRRFVTLYYRHNPDAREVVGVNPTLLGQAVHAWFVISPFIRMIVAAASDNREAGKDTKGHRFTRTMHERVVALLRALRAATEKKAFRRALVEVETELRRYVGLTPSEALATIRRGSRATRQRNA
jgi:uncharacterized protein YjiS (DUF1127 family)